MDGFSYHPMSIGSESAAAGHSVWPDRPHLGQHTLKAPIDCTGIGLHSGQPVSVTLAPAPPGHGIVFRRTDLAVSIPARFDAVVDTRLCTVIGAGAARVGTIEHLMAALAASGVDNLLVELDGPELPVLDGSAEPWLFLVDCAGLAPQDAPRASIEILRTVRAEEGDAFAELRPGSGEPAQGLSMALSIEFEAAAIGRQALSFTFSPTLSPIPSPSRSPDSFRRDLAAARTFAQKHEIEGLRRMGLARGGSLDNAVVVDGATVLNPSGLRRRDEFVRHKLLDAVGDLALAGAALHGRFVGHKSGHALNNRVLAALFADPVNWRLTHAHEAGAHEAGAHEAGALQAGTHQAGAHEAGLLAA